MRSSLHSSHFLTVSLKRAQRLVPPGLVLSKVGPSTQSFNASIVLGFERVEENVHTDSATEHTYYIPSPTGLAGLRNVVEDWINPMPAQGASWLRANLRVKNPAETIKPNTLPHSSFMGFPLRLFACFDSGVANLLGGVFVVFETP